MSVNFPNFEEETIRLWRDIDAFQTQLKLTEGGPRFSFYDGPPFGMYPFLAHLLQDAGANCMLLQPLVRMPISRCETLKSIPQRSICRS